MPDNNAFQSGRASAITDITLSPEQAAILVLLARVETLERAIGMMRGDETLPRVKMKSAGK